MSTFARAAILAAIATLLSWFPSSTVPPSAPLLASVGRGCPSTVSCGDHCLARRTNGFCVDVLDIDTKRPGGAGAKIPIGVSVRCTICECWYKYLGSDGWTRFKRSTKGSCPMRIVGITVFGPA